MMQSTELTCASDDEQVSPEPAQPGMVTPTREGVELAFVDSLAQFDELYRQLAR